MVIYERKESSMLAVLGSECTNYNFVSPTVNSYIQKSHA